MEYKIGDTVVFSMDEDTMRDYRKYVGYEAMSDDDILGNYFLEALSMIGLSLKDVAERGIEPVLDELKTAFLDVAFLYMMERDIASACEEKGIEYTKTGDF